MRKQIVMVVTALMVPNMSFAEDLYPKEVCKQIYDSIGVFLAVADKALPALTLGLSAEVPNVPSI